MTENEIRQKLLEILENVSPTVDQPADMSDKGLGELGYDSLDLSSFALEIEETFNVKISDDELATLITVNDFAALVQGKSA